MEHELAVLEATRDSLAGYTSVLDKKQGVKFSART